MVLKLLVGLGKVYKGGEADVPLFETESKTCMISAHKRVISLKFGTAVAFVKNNMEL